jgi:hypothetical protein
VISLRSVGKMQTWQTSDFFILVILAVSMLPLSAFFRRYEVSLLPVYGKRKACLPTT